LSLNFLILSWLEALPDVLFKFFEEYPKNINFILTKSYKS